jgi:tRNA wybutosine-synthesizing protein 2
VGVNDISVRMVEIEDHLRFLLKKNGNDPREFKAEHAELVKTFAPGVWHCVFDIYIEPENHGSSTGEVLGQTSE